MNHTRTFSFKMSRVAYFWDWRASWWDNLILKNLTQQADFYLGKDNWVIEEINFPSSYSPQDLIFSIKVNCKRELAGILPNSN